MKPLLVVLKIITGLLYAVKDRVQGLHLAEDRPIASISTLPLSTWLPNADECRALRQDSIILAARVLLKHLPWFSCIKSVVVSLIVVHTNYLL